MDKTVDAPVSKWKMIEYENNPSVDVVAKKQRTGTRRITNKTGDKAMIVSESGEILAPAGFHETIEVDRTQFVKLYVSGIKLFNGLSAPGAKIFGYLYKIILGNPNSDTVTLHFKDAKNISRVTFDRGVLDLLHNEIIYKSTAPHRYFLNVDYLFNGNSLAFIKEYRMKEELPEPQQNLPL